MENKVAAQGELLAISRKVLLYAYLVLPVLLAIVLVDMFFLNSRFCRPWSGSALQSVLHNLISSAAHHRGLLQFL